MSQPAVARETLIIVNAKGLHARASAKFVNMTAMLPEGLDVRVIKDGTEAGGQTGEFCRQTAHAALDQPDAALFDMGDQHQRRRREKGR